MSSRISNTTIDSRNAYQQSVWWAQVLGMREDPHDPNEPGHAECMIFSADGRTRLLFIEDRKPNRSRIGFTSIFDAEVERPRGLGATEVADHHRPDGSGWVTLADPEGNEFCVLRSDREISDPYAHLIS